MAALSVIVVAVGIPRVNQLVMLFVTTAAAGVPKAHKVLIGKLCLIKKVSNLDLARGVALGAIRFVWCL